MPDYPTQVAEAQGDIVPSGNKGPFNLIVTGGVRAFTRYTAFRDTFSLAVGPGAPANATWVRRASLPLEITHAAVAVVGNFMYLCGGYLGRYPGPSVNNCYEYDSVMDKFNKFPSLPIMSAGGGMVYEKKMNSLFFSTGTFREDGIPLATDFADSYMIDLGNLSAGWVRKADIPNPRNHIGVVTVRGRHFFLGGQYGRDEFKSAQRTLSEYVAKTDTWKKWADIPSVLSHIQTSVKNFKNKGFLVIGGSIKFGQITDTVYFYHLESNTWHLVGTYPRRTKTAVCGSFKNMLYCAAGQAPKGERWDTSYKIALGKLKKL